MQKNRILLVFPGPEYHLKVQKLEALSDNFTGTVVTSSPRLELQQTTHVGSFKYRCFNITYNNRALSNMKYFLLVLLFAIGERLNKTQYDLIVTYDPLKTGMLGALCSFILRCKFAPEVNGVYHNAAEYLDGPRVSTFIKSMAYPIIQKLVLLKASGVKTLFPGQIEAVVGNRDLLVQSFPNHVDIDIFLSLSVDNSPPVILFAGFPFKRKGVDVLIEAFKKVHPLFPNWELRIVGWYPDMNLLNTYIASHPKIKHFPPVEYKDMPALMSECSIFVLPSRSEAMGRVLVESMASGKARIGSRIEGIPYVIDDGIDGLLFESANPTDLAEVMVRLIEDESLRARLGSNARSRAEKLFTKEIYVDNIIKFYQKVIDK